MFTSNVDGQFQRAGFSRDSVVECHGTLEFLQCTTSCGAGIFSAEHAQVEVDHESMRAKDPLPQCGGCGALARPNVLMFGDWGWDSALTEDQDRRLSAWVASIHKKQGRIAIVELGAGTGVPTVRMMSERTAAVESATLIRINVREPEVPDGHIGIAEGAKAALTAIEQCLSSSKA